MFIKYFFKFIIKGSTLSDQSTFTCIVRNQFGEQRKNTNLVITGLGLLYNKIFLIFLNLS
jgi:hypothetical protein